jgi:hypothetical protein
MTGFPLKALASVVSGLSRTEGSLDVRNACDTTAKVVGMR